jgi:hypothetical protein
MNPTRRIWRDKTTGEEARGSGAMAGWYASHPERYEQTSVPRLYHVVAINDRTGRKDYCTATPVTHHEACTIRSKFFPRPKGAYPAHVRIQLEEVSPWT